MGTPIKMCQNMLVLSRVSPTSVVHVIVTERGQHKLNVIILEKGMAAIKLEYVDRKINLQSCPRMLNFPRVQDARESVRVPNFYSHDTTHNHIPLNIISKTKRKSLRAENAYMTYVF